MARWPKRSQRAALAALGMAFALLAGPRLWAISRLHLVARLTDGSELAVLSVTYGRQHPAFHPDPFSDVPPPPLWARLANLWHRIRQRAASSRPSSPPPALYTKDDSLVIWLSREGGSPPYKPYPGTCRAMAVDRHGCAFSGSLVSQSDSGVHAMAAYAFQAFPRRERVFPVQVCEGGTEVVARFVVRNPVYRRYPRWKPQPLPATVRHGDLEFTLRDFAFEGEHGTHQAVRVTRNGIPLREWRTRDSLYNDATGNTSRTPTLCRYEGAWGLRETFEHSPLPDAAEGLGASFPAVEVPPPGQQRSVDLAATSDGVTLRVESIASDRKPPRGEMPHGRYGVWGEGGRVFMRLRSSQDAALNFQAFRIRDEWGRDLPVGLARRGRGEWSLVTRANPDSRLLHIEFSAEARDAVEVEFRVAPLPVSGTGASPSPQ